LPKEIETPLVQCGRTSVAASPALGRVVYGSALQFQPYAGCYSWQRI